MNGTPFRAVFPLLCFLLMTLVFTHWLGIELQWGGSGARWPTLRVLGTPLDLHQAVLVAIVCGLPGLGGLAASQLAATTRSIDLPRRGNSPSLQSSGTAAPSAASTFDAEIVEGAGDTIRTEYDRMLYLHAHADLHARIWGFLGTLTLSVSALIIEPAESVSKLLADGDRDMVNDMIIASTSAVAISFLLGFAQVLVRSAAHDAGTRMFSCASRDLLISVGVSLFAAAFLHKTFESAGAVGMGLAAGLMGPRALLPLKQRAAGVLGVAPSADSKGLPLAMIEGLNDEIVQRLGEEGLDSVHALAFTNTPRIYFATPYTWERICDWQSQAVLLEQLGLARFAKYKEQFPIRTVEEALTMLKDPSAVESCAKALGIASAQELQAVLDAIGGSRSLALLRQYSRHGNALLDEVLREADAEEPSARSRRLSWWSRPPPLAPVPRDVRSVSEVAPRPAKSG
jgi:hypothetical protein